jgi:hypothetical protein
MSEQIIDIADLDCIFLTYDEPRKEEFWILIDNMVPWAERVDGIKGSDTAHKTAAHTSTTDWFVLIDGDNIPDAEFFNKQLVLTDEHQGGAFRWKARNAVNGLMYGNGGISVWSKEFVLGMKTHESSDGTEANDVEFCFYPNYFSMNDCYSTTHPNQTEFQAWRAGFREGVKMCLDRGRKPTMDEFEQRVHARNYDNLCVWQSVGADADNGFWAIYGARLGTYMTMIEGWNYKDVQDFDVLARLWESFSQDGSDQCKSVGDILRKKLGMPIVDMDPEESKFFKHHYKSQHKNLGIMTKE